MKKHILPKIVSLEDIPAVANVPTENLIDIFRVCTQLERVCTDNFGAGLAAAQVGIPWKLFVAMGRVKKSYRYFVNCDYVGLGEKFKSIEGCLSLRNADGGLRRFEVDRYSSVRITGKELVVTHKGVELVDLDEVFDDFLAILCQHEVDHQYRRERMIDVIGKEIEVY